MWANRHFAAALGSRLRFVRQLNQFELSVDRYQRMRYNRCRLQHDHLRVSYPIFFIEAKDGKYALLKHVLAFIFQQAGALRRTISFVNAPGSSRVRLRHKPSISSRLQTLSLRADPELEKVRACECGAGIFETRCSTWVVATGTDLWRLTIDAKGGKYVGSVAAPATRHVRDDPLSAAIIACRQDRKT